MRTSIGYHTFAISMSLTQAEADVLLKDFKKYRNDTNDIYIDGPNTYPKDRFGRHCKIKY